MELGMYLFKQCLFTPRIVVSGVWGRISGGGGTSDGLQISLWSQQKNCVATTPTVN